MTSKMKIFWSWQSDYSSKNCRQFIRVALEAAIKEIASEYDVDDADRPEIDHDTKGERGMADIATTILNKIADSAVFVADLTPIVQTSDGKWLPNPNVMIELGWAMHRPGWERVVGILNTGSGARVEDLPFDIRQRRIVTYLLDDAADKHKREQVKSELVNKIKDAILTNVQERADSTANEMVVKCVAAKSDNFSIWSSAGETLTHNDAFGGVSRETLRLPDVPRAYMRVIPSGWKKGSAPGISEIATLGVQAPSDGASQGNYGATDEGFVRYWVTGFEGDLKKSSNITMFFEDTGEFWMLHGSVVGETKGKLCLRDHLMLGAWSRMLREAMNSMDQYEANKTRLVEIGLFGVGGVHWFADWENERTPSRRNCVQVKRQSHDWSADAQLTFLADAYNQVRNLFAKTRSSEAEVIEILKSFDPERFNPAH